MIFLVSQDEPFVFGGTTAELFRTVRVVAEVPFIELSPGHLVNLTAVERIGDDTPELPALPGEVQAVWPGRGTPE